MAFKCFLVTESVSGTKPALRSKVISESLASAGRVCIIAVSVVIGHNVEAPR